MNENKKIYIEITEEELRFLIRSGDTLIMWVPHQALPTYCNFIKEEIEQFTDKLVAIRDELGIDM